MSLILATGSNIGNSLENLQKTSERLQDFFKLIAASSIYQSEPVEYLNQPIFYNQVLEFELPCQGPARILEIIQSIEKENGTQKSIPKGPRMIDIDLIFLGFQLWLEKDLYVPHPSWRERSFICLPLQELPFFQELCKIDPGLAQQTAWPSWTKPL